jgi:hypothetical protein
MDSKRRVSKGFNDNLKGSRLRARPKNRWWNCVYKKILPNAKLKTGERGQKQS